MDEIAMVYVCIGNSDDRLTQRRWVLFQLGVKQTLRDHAAHLHGEWHSYPDSIYQNACFCFEVETGKVPVLKERLAELARIYDQVQGLSWVETTATEFLIIKAA